MARVEKSDFDKAGFAKLLKEKMASARIPREELARRSGGDISAQTLNLYVTQHRFPVRHPRWLPLIKLFSLTREEVLRLDRRECTAIWLGTLTNEDLQPYQSIPWQSQPITTEDLQFLLQVSEGLKSPLTLGIVVELMKKR